jgi:hypothetical protein
MPARHALKVIDDRPIQILVAKPRENPAGRAVPVQRMLTVLEPPQALTLRGTAARVADDCNWIQVSHSPAMSWRRCLHSRRQSTALDVGSSRLVPVSRVPRGMPPFQSSEPWAQVMGAPRVHPHKHWADYPPHEHRGVADFGRGLGFSNAARSLEVSTNCQRSQRRFGSPKVARSQRQPVRDRRVAGSNPA